MLGRCSGLSRLRMQRIRRKETTYLSSPESDRHMTHTGKPKKKPGKLLGDAGEHYALSQFSFAGKYAAKMPDNWEAYDLAVETGHGLVRVSVKTRSESAGWVKSRWFNFDDRKDCDWIVLIFKPIDGLVRSWVIPYDIAKELGNKPGSSRKEPWFRDLSWAKFNREPLTAYEDNWSLDREPRMRSNDPSKPTPLRGAA